MGKPDREGDVGAGVRTKSSSHSGIEHEGRRPLPACAQRGVHNGWRTASALRGSDLADEQDARAEERPIQRQTGVPAIERLGTGESTLRAETPGGVEVSPQPTPA